MISKIRKSEKNELVSLIRTEIKTKKDVIDIIRNTSPRTGWQDDKINMNLWTMPVTLLKSGNFVKTGWL